MKKIPLLSIVIPTRNREEYCIHAIKHILSFDEQDFELIIQDNSDTTRILDYVKKNKDTRLKYHYTPERINSLINMDYAISLATGKYITMIGDDDTVLPNIFDVVKYANKFGYDSISQKNVVPYFWPNSLEAGSSGKLHLNQFSFQKNMPDVNKNLNLFLKNGMIDYLSFDFPKVYHGLVSKNVLDKIKNKTGHYFGGLSPDIYAAMSLSFFTKRFIVIDYPFSVGGICKSSTTAQGITGGHRGELKTAPHLYKRGNYIWDKRIPRYYSVESIWAESAFKGFIESGNELLLKDFRFPYFVLFAIWRGKGIRKLIIKKVLNSQEGLFSKIILFLNTLAYIMPFLVTKILKLIQNKNTNNTQTIKNIDNIELAVNEVMINIPTKFPFKN
jgi:glycosyltransferase involved in cell wall biosynthesis